MLLQTDWFPSEDRADIPDEGILCFDDETKPTQTCRRY